MQGLGGGMVLDKEDNFKDKKVTSRFLVSISKFLFTVIEMVEEKQVGALSPI